MLSLLKSGPRQLKNDIVVYLALLIEDLKIMCEEGAEVFDAYHQEYFKLQAILLWTINDFSAYGDLSGYIVKGHKACPIYEEDIFSLQLNHGRKTVFLVLEILAQVLSLSELQKALNRSTEEGRALKVLTSEEVYEQVNHLRASYGKEKKIIVEKNVEEEVNIF